MTTTGLRRGRTRSAALLAGLVLGLVLGLTTLPARATPAGAAPTAAPTIEPLAVEELGYGPGVRVQLRLEGWDSPASSDPAFVHGFRLALAEPGVPDVLAAPADELGWSEDVRTRLSAGGVTLDRQAAVYRLEPGAAYSFYVAQPANPRHGIPQRQVELPLELDWSQLEPEVSLDMAATTTVPYGSWRLPITVADAPAPSFVDLAGLHRGPRRAQVGLPPYDFRGPRTTEHDYIGTYTVQATLDVPDGAVGDGLTATGQVRVVPARTATGASFIRVPTPSVTGLLRTGVEFETGFGTSSAHPGPVAWKVFRDGREVWYSGVQTLRYRELTVVRIPALPRGTYQLGVDYAGAANTLGSRLTRSFAVR
ncbi:MAG TPA: hypothetical protein VGE77_11940 [Nocardioides sp.]